MDLQLLIFLKTDIKDILLDFLFNKLITMNENIDLTKILKDCPIGTEFYHAGYGKVWFCRINLNNNYPILLSFDSNKINTFGVTSKGTINNTYEGECLLFPSKEQRDWSKFTTPWYKKEKFDPKTLKPFDKVLVRTTNLCWHAVIFSHIDKATGEFKCSSSYWEKCIPYNDNTKHLVGTTEEAPKYYRYWEK